MKEGAEPHDCIDETHKVSKARPDTKSVPFLENNVELYINGSYKTNRLKAGFAVVRKENNGGFLTIAHGEVRLPLAQRAELVALQEELRRSPGETVNIFTDSAFTYFVVHRDLGGWVRNGWKTATGDSPKHEEVVQCIFELLSAPAQLAVIKVPAHKNVGTIHAKGNAAADNAAKQVAGLELGTVYIMKTVEEEYAESVRPQSLFECGHMLAGASFDEQNEWSKWGAKSISIELNEQGDQGRTQKDEWWSQRLIWKICVKKHMVQLMWEWMQRKDV